MFNHVQNHVETEEIAPLILRGTSLEIKRSYSPFVVIDPENSNNNFSLTSDFQEFQKECIDVCNYQGFILETHPFQILALSSIILMKPNQYPDDLLRYINIDQLELARFNLLKKILLNDDYEDVSFDLELKIKVTITIKVILDFHSSIHITEN